MTSPCTTPSPVHRGRGARWAGSSMAVALLAVAGTFGVMATGEALWPEDAMASVSAVQPLQPANELVLTPPPRLRCETCGHVETITYSAGVDGAPDAYIFAVRLPDGSLRQSSDPRPGRWQVGDAMQLLGGGATWSQHRP